MRNRFLFLSTLAAALSALAPTSFAQLVDRVNQIDGFVLEAEEIAYFNATQCDVPEDTTYELRLSTDAGAAVSQVYLWAGKQNGECHLNSNRTDITANCREIVGNPRTVQPDSLIIDLTLQELIDTGVVACDTSGLEGTPYEIFAFRTSDPGSTDVPQSDYGISLVTIDVMPPNELNVTNGSPLIGQNFVIAWTRPTDQIEFYRFYCSDDDDPVTAMLLSITAGENATSQTITDAQLMLEGCNTVSTFLYVSAVDKAFQLASPGIGNEGPLSSSTEVSVMPTSGVCGDPAVNPGAVECSGCSMSPMMLATGQPGPMVWLIGLVFAIAVGRRLRR
jgi:hypothetical protein